MGHGKHNGRSVETFVVYPESKTKTPVVLIIHEIFGLTDWVQDLADQVAAAGYIAVAPDLLSGMGPNGGRTPDFPQGGATQAVSHLNPDQVTADLKAVADYGLKLPSADGKLYVAGSAGAAARVFALRPIAAALPLPLFSMDRPPIKTPCHASRRRFMGFMPGTMPALALRFRKRVENMKTAGKTYEPVTYEGAGHGFMRAGEAPDANEANRKARQDAWVRWKKLLGAS